MTFDTLGLNPKLLKAVEALGFEHPTPIQEKVITAILGGQNDLIGLAQTGTGKKPDGLIFRFNPLNSMREPEKLSLTNI